MPVRYAQLVPADNHGNVRCTQLNSVEMTGSCAALETPCRTYSNGCST